MDGFARFRGTCSHLPCYRGCGSGTWDVEGGVFGKAAAERLRETLLKLSCGQAIFTCGKARWSMDDKMSVGGGGGDCVNLSPWKI